MERAELKPVDIQRYLGLTCVQTVYRWVSGRTIPTIDNLYSLSQLFGVHIDDMIMGNRKSKVQTVNRQLIHRVMTYSSWLSTEKPPF